MKSYIKWIIYSLLIVLVGIQFIPTSINQQDITPYTDIRNVYTIPDNVLTVLEVSCYDCHSNNTNYPFYSRIQPMAMLMDKHVREGKEELNFSEFGDYSDRKKRNKLFSIQNQVKDGEMPLSSYTLMHNDAKLTANEKKLIEE
ncbi:MAG TPA: heme-binding domain-containing protein, partial [Brumimicrobium sp.]|nr:heme-binding domain-containing protein [Brumimicrobium sp.]